MNRLLLSIVVGLALQAVPVIAGVIERDWLAPGDGLLTYDDVNRREWLDIPFTIENFPVLVSRNPLPRFDMVLNATMPGGLLDGFMIAQSHDVIGLAESAGIDTALTSLAVNEEATRRLVELLGAVLAASGGHVSTIGMIDELADLSQSDRLLAGIGATPRVDSAGLYFYAVSDFSLDFPSRYVGVMLYRAIPEPSTYALVLVGVALVLIILRGEKKRTNYLLA